MKPTSPTGATFIAGGSIAGAGISSTVGGIGIGVTPLVGAGAVTGAAIYGAFQAVAQGDTGAFAAMGMGAVGGMGVSSVVGGIGFVAPKVGLAFGIGTVPIAGMGAVLGLAAYGVAKMLDTSQVQETPLQVVERMEAKVLEKEFYIDALIELNSFLAGEDLNQKFAALEIEAEL